MNTRKFSFVLSSIIAIFLFVTGLIITAKFGLIDVHGTTNNPLGRLLGGGNGNSAKDPINVLVLGGDKVNQNTDTIMLVNFNPATGKINLMSIPRDTRVKINGKTQKINAAYPIGGEELAMETVGNLLGLTVDHYVFVDTSVFREIIDILGGVDYNVPIDMKYDDPSQNLHINLKKGMQHLDGDKAEQFMRFRHPNGHYTKEMLKYYDGSDLKRIEAQQSFIKELIRQKANLYNITKLKSLIEVAFKKFDTNISMNTVLSMAPSIVKINGDSYTTFRLSGDDKKISGIWYFEYNDKVLNNATQETLSIEDAIKKYFYANSQYASNSGSKDTQPAFNDQDTNDKEDTPSSSKSSTKKTNTVKKPTTSKNPSNTETGIKKPTTYKP